MYKVPVELKRLLRKSVLTILIILCNYIYNFYSMASGIRQLLSVQLRMNKLKFKN